MNGDGAAIEVEAPWTPSAGAPLCQSCASCRPDEADLPGGGEVVEQQDPGQSATPCFPNSEDTGYDGDPEISSNPGDTSEDRGPGEPDRNQRSCQSKRNVGNLNTMPTYCRMCILALIVCWMACWMLFVADLVCIASSTI